MPVDDGGQVWAVALEPNWREIDTPDGKRFTRGVVHCFRNYITWDVNAPQRKYQCVKHGVEADFGTCRVCEDHHHVAGMSALAFPAPQRDGCLSAHKLHYVRSDVCDGCWQKQPCISQGIREGRKVRLRLLDNG